MISSMSPFAEARMSWEFVRSSAFSFSGLPSEASQKPPLEAVAMPSRSSFLAGSPSRVTTMAPVMTAGVFVVSIDRMRPCE
jgi:hypothetical protein